jgi:hypothetical protein
MPTRFEVVDAGVRILIVAIAVALGLAGAWLIGRAMGVERDIWVLLVGVGSGGGAALALHALRSRKRQT